MAALEAMGYEDVKVLKGGSFGGWVEAGYPVVEGLPPDALVLNVADPDPQVAAKMDEMLSGIPEGWGVITAETLNTELIENPDTILIDVRRQEELDEKGTIDAANVIHIPIESFVEMKDMWPADKDAPIVVYCGSGHRSTIAMAILWANGYTDVHSLKGGFGGWQEAGYPVAGGAAELDTAFAEFLGGMEKYNTIGLEDANAALAEDPPPFLLDVREIDEVAEKGHIEGAVVIPLRELGQNLDVLPSLDTPIIAYCGSGWRATVAMAALEAMGYEDVKVLKGGSFGGWVEAGYPIVEGLPPDALVLNVADPDPQVAAKMDEMLSQIPEGWGVITAETLNTELAENPDTILIDVRRQEEVDEKGMIDAPNVIHIPIESFVEMKELWPADKDAPIVVYCGSGHRSTIAMAILWANGYTDVHSLKGGFGGWQEAGYPVAGGAADLDTAFATFLGGMEAYNTVGLDDLNLILAEDPPPYILDVRQPEELEAAGHIEGAVNIPLREVADNIEFLPSFDTTIVSYCGSGWRCTIAAAALEALGWENVLALKGGSFGGWVDGGYPVIAGAAAEPLLLDVAEPDAALLAEIQGMLQAVPEGYGVITAEALNTQLVENPDTILIDVRRTEELAEKGIIESENWMHIPLEDFIAMKDQWPADLDAPIVIYCGSGHRSTLAMAILWSYGYTNVHSLKGGFGGWVEAGYPVAEFAPA
jgi:rhodanese-related sulfurtransferase